MQADKPYKLLERKNMKKLFNMIKNYKDLNIDDLLTVANSFEYFVPGDKVADYYKSISKVLDDYSLSFDTSPFEISKYSNSKNEICKVLDEYVDYNYFGVIEEFLKDNMFDTSNCNLNDMFSYCNKTQLVVFLEVILRLRRHSHLFMTYDNFIGFWSEIVNECRKVDPAVKENLTLDFYDYLCVPPIDYYVLDEEVIKKLILKYLDLNIILADNTFEAIENNDSDNDEILVQNAFQYINQTVHLHKQLLYKGQVILL